MKRITTISILLYLCCGISFASRALGIDSAQAIELHSSMPQGVWIITAITTTATFLSIITAIVFIVWFVRDIRKENSKNLKFLTETLNKHTEILKEIVKGQREGFITMNKSLVEIQKSGERMEKSSKRMEKRYEIMEKSSARREMIQTKILEKIITFAT